MTDFWRWVLDTSAQCSLSLLEPSLLERWNRKLSSMHSDIVHVIDPIIGDDTTPLVISNRGLVDLRNKNQWISLDEIS